jgi:arylsulfatase A-like enzyme
MGARLKIALPTRRTLFDAFGLAAILGAALVLAKIDKLLGMSDGEGAGWIPVAIAWDLLFALSLGALWSVILTLTSRPRRGWAYAAISGVTWILLVFLIGEHGFYHSTGSVLDAHLVTYTFENFGELRAVLASEVPVAAIAGVLVSLAMIVSLQFLAGRAGVRAWLDAGSSLSGSDASMRRFGGTLAVGLLVCAVGASFHVPADLAPLEGSPVVSVIRGLLLGSDVEEGLSDLEATLHTDVQLISGEETRPLNVVMVVLESTRTRSTTAYNEAIPTTPVLKRLADEGVLVEEAYTVVPHTSKALIGIHCGAWPRIKTAIVEAEPGALPTPCLAELLSEHGYSTAFFQTAQENYEGRAGLVENFGFETFVGKESLEPTGFDECSYFGYEDDAMFGPSMAWIDRQKGPFFAAYLTLTPHHDYKVPRGFDSVALAADEELNGYLNTLRYVDRFLGRVHAGLEERGLLENTILVVVGDHGEGFAEHGRRQHDNVIYEEGLRVPLILAGAGLTGRARRISGLRQTIDILPTIAELLGMRLEGELPGRSLFDPEGHEAIYASCWYSNRCLSIRRGDRKFIHHYNRRGLEVFDLRLDPLEKDNLLGTDPGLDAEAEREKSAMLEWKRRVNRTYRAHDARRRSLFIRDAASPLTSRVDVMFEEFARLRGYDAGALRVRRGERLEVDLHFEVLADPASGWRLFTHVMNARGMVLNADHVPALGAHPVRKWRTGQFIQDVNRIRIPATFKPGRYSLAIGFWRKSAGGEVSSRAEVSGPDDRVDSRRFAHVLEFEVLP